MKKLLIGLTLLASMSSFAAEKLEVTVKMLKSKKEMTCLIDFETLDISSELGATGYYLDAGIASGVLKVTNAKTENIMALAEPVYPVRLVLGSARSVDENSVEIMVIEKTDSNAEKCSGYNHFKSL